MRDDWETVRDTQWSQKAKTFLLDLIYSGKKRVWFEGSTRSRLVAFRSFVPLFLLSITRLQGDSGDVPASGVFQVLSQLASSNARYWTGGWRKGGNRYFSPSLPVSKTVAISLGRYFPSVTHPSPRPFCQGWWWLSTIVNFWTASLSPVGFLVLLSLVETIPCIKVSFL